MDKKHKFSYNPPKVTTVTFMVENGMLGGNNSWDGATTSSSTSHFGNGEWTGGSSFSNNSSFGNDTWNN